jgi:hypothetical protein
MPMIEQIKKLRYFFLLLVFYKSISFPKNHAKTRRRKVIFSHPFSHERNGFACVGLFTLFFLAIASGTVFSQSDFFFENKARRLNDLSAFADTTPPKISAISISNLTSTSVTISWRTDEKADSEVEYGFTTSYGLLSKYDTSLVVSHAVTVTALRPDATYHFRVLSRDAAGNLAASRDSVFTTPMRSAALYSPIEVTLTTERRYYLPYVEVAVTGIFISPTGKELRLAGFWDGGQTWKVRFAPNETGIWRYRTESEDSELIVSGRFLALPAAPAERGFVRVSKTRPYGFEYSDGTPFLLMGDTIWDGMSSGVGFEARFKPYINLRAAQHFNAYHAIVVNNRYDYQSNEGGAPYAMFNEAVRDYNRLNPDFFKWVDKRVAYADSMGMVSILFFTWAAEARHMSTDDYRRLALYIVARCAAYNVFWILAGDYQAYFYEPALYREIGKAVDAADPFDHPISIHPADDFVNREFAKESWLSYVMHQLRDAGEFLADSIRYDRVYNKPVVNGEYGYHVPESVHPHHGIRNNASYIRTGGWSIFSAGGYFVAGFGRTFFDPDGHYGYDPGFDHPPMSWNLNYAPDLEMARQYGVVYRFFRDQTNWVLLEPHPELVADDQTEMLAKPGIEYIAYKARGDRMRLRLPLGQDFSLSWFNPITGSLDVPRIFEATVETVLILPSDTMDAVAVLRPTAAPPLLPAGNVASLQSEQMNIRQVRFRWITPESADSRIDIQKPSGAHIQFIDAAYTTQHEMIIDGLAANIKYKIAVLSQAPNGREWKTIVQCVLTDVVVLDRYIEAESMPTKTVGRAELPGWNLDRNGYLATTVNFPQSGAHRFEILARGEYRQQTWPKLTLEIDNVKPDTLTINSAVFKWFNSTREIAAGTRTVKLGFANAGNDRQLIIDQLHIQFIGVPATPPPVISAIKATNITTTAATINWKTDRPTEAQIEYGLSANYNLLTPAEVCRDTAHVFTLTGLTQNTTYHFRARAKDAANKLAISRDTTFTTLVDRQPPIFSNIAATNLTAISAAIIWTTDEKSTSQIEFGLDSTLGRSTALSSALVTQHEVTLSNLAAYKKYYYRVKSTDEFGNAAASRQFTFTTLPTIDRLVLVSGEAQLGKPGKLLAAPLVVKVLNTAGAAMPNVSVVFRVISGGGRIFGVNNCSNTECVIATAADGTASAQWQIGAIEPQKVEAAVVNRQDLVVPFTAKIDLTGVVSDDDALPVDLTLQPRPNPFSDLTQFEIALPNPGRVSLKIFDLQGREVVALFDAAKSAGRFFVPWNGRDQANRKIASGAYFAVLQYEPEQKGRSLLEKKQVLYLK